MRTTRSAPIANAFRSASSERWGPSETSTTSAPASSPRRRSASSTAFASKGFSVGSADRSRRFVAGSIRRACSGTAFAQTAIFIRRRTLSAGMQKPERLLGCRPSPNGRERKKLAVLQQTWVSGRTSKSRGLLHGIASDAVEREAELMKRHRTTARPALFLILAAGLLAGSAAARSGGTTKPIVFPILGAAHYVDDFGDARPGGMHQGIDMMAAKKSLALAAEAGKVKFWTTSAAAGCMLYLYGESGTTYIYIHLNNDVTDGNDNGGVCEPGMSYAPGLADGDEVTAGELIGYVGDSGDANGIHPHLHFEVHPHDGEAVSPYRHLRRAMPLLYAVAPPGARDEPPTL